MGKSSKFELAINAHTATRPHCTAVPARSRRRGDRIAARLFWGFVAPKIHVRTSVAMGVNSGQHTLTSRISPFDRRWPLAAELNVPPTACQQRDAGAYWLVVNPAGGSLEQLELCRILGDEVDQAAL